MRARLLADRRSRIYVNAVLCLVFLVSLVGLGIIVAQSPLFSIIPARESYTVNEQLLFTLNTSESVELRVHINNRTYLFPGNRLILVRS